jgi:hypothetical protein
MGFGAPGASSRSCGRSIVVPVTAIDRRKRAVEVVQLWNARLAALENPLFMPTIRMEAHCLGASGMNPAG